MTVCLRQSIPAAAPYSRATLGGRPSAARDFALGVAAMFALWAQCFACGTAMAARPAAAAASVVMTRAQQIKRGLALRPVAARIYVRSATAYGRVLNPQHLGALGARLQAAQAREQAAAAALGQLAGQGAGPGDPPPGASRRLRAARARLGAEQEALRAALRTARARWGAALARAALQGTADFTALASGQAALVELLVPNGLDGVPAPEHLRLRPLDNSGKPVMAQLLSRSPRLIPPAPGAGFFYRAASAALQPGLRVVARLPLSSKRVSGVLIPKSAVTWADGHAWAYVQTAPTRFVRRAVPTDRPMPGGWFVAQGWRPGERVVVRGAAALAARAAQTVAPSMQP